MSQISFERLVKMRMAEFAMNSNELARRTEYSYQYISNLLNKDRRWNEINQKRVCEALGIKITYENIPDFTPQEKAS
jgi:hypothetical protein